MAVDRAALGGLSLMERLVGYRRAVIVDAIHTGASPVGTVTRCRLADLVNPSEGYSTSTHDMSLATALTVGRALGAAVPDTIDIVGVEIPARFEFSEALSPPVAAAVPRAAAAVFECLSHPCVTASSLELRQEGASHGVP